SSRRSPAEATLVLAAERRGDRVELSVRSNACRWPADLSGEHTLAELASQSTSRGLELSLHVAREIIALHGGTLDLAAQAAWTGELTVSLPRTRCRTADHPIVTDEMIAATLRAQLQPCKVLVVDDDRDV